MRTLNRYSRAVIGAALLLVTVAFSGCNDDKLKIIATNVDRVALLIKDGREVRDELEEQGIIDQAEAKAITKGLLKVDRAFKAFNTRARGYVAAGALTPTGKVELKKLADDIVSAVQELVSNGTFGVKDVNAQIRINATVGALKQVTLAIADTVSLIKTKGGQ